MPSARPALMVFFCVLLLAGAVGCPQPGAASAATNPENVLRSYEVPAGYASEIRDLVNRLAYRGKDAINGTVAIAPNGQLLVSAPLAIQAGVQQLVEDLRAHPPTPAPAVTFDYWIVAGVPAPEGEESASAKVAPEIAATLDAPLASQGPMKLALLERLRVSSRSGAEAKVDGAAVAATQSATVQGGRVIADVYLVRQHGPGRLQAQVHIPVGKTVVLGQAGALLSSGEPLAPVKPGEPQPATLFYVVRAAVDSE